VRVVALACSNTEIVCALGLADQLVGVDDHSDYPVDVVSRLPRVGPDLGIDIDKVAALKPDLVLASLTVPGHERIVAALERAQLPFVAPEPKTLSDVYDDVMTIARRLGAESRGRALVAEMRTVLDASRPARRRRPKILVEWWPKPVIVPGADSWVTQLLERVGAENPFALRPVKSTPITDAEAIDAHPDAVVISWCGVRTEKYRKDVVLRRPSWQPLDCIRDERVYAVPEAFLGRPGPRLVDGYKTLRAIADELAASEL
jgi:iron complex transport system substrate-binding protein